ncbi:MAG: SagB/ThcOx family dehydrogenase [Actinomycetota bacterium]
MSSRDAIACVLVLAMAANACNSGDVGSVADEGPEVLETIELPAPNHDGPLALEKTLWLRRSVRSFTERELTLAEVGQLLWAGQGQNRESGARTNPSAGGLYPLELYVVTPNGMLHYLPDDHRAEIITHEDLRIRLAAAALGQEAVEDAPAVFIVCGVFSRTEARYGGRAERYVYLEAGHAAQSLLLQAVALDMGGVPIGAFDDGAVADLLDLPADHDVVYLMPVGHPGDDG